MHRCHTLRFNCLLSFSFCVLKSLLLLLLLLQSLLLLSILLHSKHFEGDDYYYYLFQNNGIQKYRCVTLAKCLSLARSYIGFLLKLKLKFGGFHKIRKLLYLRSREKNRNKKRKTSKQHFLLSIFIILTVTLRYVSAIHVKLKKQNYQSTKAENVFKIFHFVPSGNAMFDCYRHR